MMNDVHDLAALYVLDALPNDERRTFEGHLEECRDCRKEVQELRETASSLGALERATPSPATREHVLAAIARTPQEGESPREPLTLRRRRRAVAWLFAAAVAAVAAIVIAVGLVSIGDRTDQADAIRDVLSAGDVALTVLEGPEGVTASFVYSDEQGRGVFITEGLAPVAAAETYQLWLIGEAGPSPSGLFRPADGSVTFLVTGDIAGSTQLGVTLEPREGSPRPSGAILLVGDLA